LLKISQILFILDPIIIGLFLLLSQQDYLGVVLRDSNSLKYFEFGVIPLSIAIFYLSGAYDEPIVTNLRSSISNALLSFGILVALFLFTAYVFRISPYFPRLVIGPWMLSTVGGLILSRVSLDYLARWRRQHGFGWVSIVLTGQPGACTALADHINSNPHYGLRIKTIASDPCATHPSIQCLPLEALAAVVEEHQITKIVVCAELGYQSYMESIFTLLSQYPVSIQYAPDISKYPVLGLNISRLGSQPLIDLTTCPLDGKAQFIKWMEDKILSAMILVLISPIMVLVAIIIKVTSPGPVFFIQPRHGMYGQPISVIKFRSMYHSPPSATQTTEPEADAPEVAVSAHADAALVAKAETKLIPDEFVQATPNDPRVTKFGRFMRRTSIDELPQFINVIKGDMSIVGPRPHAPKHNHDFIKRVDYLMRRHYVKPGITGLAQINGARGETRDTIAMKKRIEYDLEYLRSWSLWLDLQIIVTTVFKGFVNRQP